MQFSIHQYIPFAILVCLTLISIIIVLLHNFKFLKLLILGSLAVYLICVFWLIFTPGVYYMGGTYYMRYFWFRTAKVVYIPAGLTSAGSLMNIIMTIPAGVYLRLLLPQTLNRFTKIILFAILTGLFNEGGQFILDLLVNIQRTVDITDVITNSIGVIVGWMFAFLFQIKPYQHGKII